MQIIDRDKCSVTGSTDLEELHIIKDFPVFMGCLNSPHNEDLFQDMVWSISKSSGVLQLSKLIPLDVLYGNSHGSGFVGSIWEKHHTEFAEFISNYNPRSVLEIGGGHGKLAKLYESHSDISWTIVEPNPTPPEDSNAIYVEGFFDEDFPKPTEIDTVVHSHVFEHIYDHIEFMENLSNKIEIGQKLIFSVPNMEVMLERMYTNCLNFEHTVFLTEPYIEYLLGNHGFKIIEKKYFLDDHSIFYSTERIERSLEFNLDDSLYNHNKKLYLDFVRYHEEEVIKLNKAIEEFSGPVFLFGAHIFSQYLVMSGLDTKKINCLLDNDPNKQTKRMYGTNLSVDSPAVLKEHDKPLVILKAGVYNDEIKEQIIEDINSQTVFL